MAEYSRVDESRSRKSEDCGLVRGTSSGKSKPTNEERTDREDKVSAFNPIKSVRSHLGSRTKDAPTESGTSRARSTGNILQDMRKGDNQRLTGTTAVLPATPFYPSTKQTRNSWGNQLSASANDLFSSSSSSSSANRWIHPSSQRIASSGTTTSSGSISSSKNITPTTNRPKHNEVSSGSSTDLIDAFFDDRWSRGHSDTRARAFSSGDAEEVVDPGQALTYDLDSIGRTKSLDVSAAKDRISIKPKGKKLTYALEERVRRAKAGLRPVVARVHQLHSLAELDEGEEEEAGGVSSKNGRSRARGQVDRPSYTVYHHSSAQEAVTQNPGGSGAPAATRKRSQAGPPVPEKSSFSLQRNSIGFSVTPAMLTGALRKKHQPTPGESSHRRIIKPTDAEVSSSPPPDGERRRRRQEEHSANEINSDSKQNCGFAALRPHVVLPRCSDEDRDKGARPKPPPKTRPKTMLHPSSVSPSEPLPPPPEWLTRLKKRSAVVE